MKSIAILTLLVLILGANSLRSLAQAGGPERSDSTSARFPGSRTTKQGEIWMGWIFPVQEWFVQGALAGYQEGYDEGCADAIREAP